MRGGGYRAFFVNLLMKFFPLLPLLTLAAHLAAAQAPARPATVKTKTKTAGPAASVKTKTSGAVALAQPAPPAGAAPAADQVTARAKALTDNMQAALALSPAQTEKVRVINTTSVRNVERARLRFRTEPRKLQGYIQDIGDARLSALKEVLTPAQFDKYQRKREEKMGIPSAPANTGTPPPGLPGEQ